MERGGMYSRLPEDSAKEKAMRSIFVANIAFETTEDQLKSVLSEVGPVMNLKLIYDPATGKPRGFGFCEYQDAETAMSAVRNLSGREVSGRPLRIDSATNAPGENFRGGGPAPAPPGPMEPPIYGSSVPPETTPEVITKVVASLPPEQMFELLKQMKWCIEHNPEETRQLLLHNPQLGYALLQAQVVMRIVDLETAQGMLHRVPWGPPLQQHQPLAQELLTSQHGGPPPAASQQQLREPPLPSHSREPPLPLHSREPPLPSHSREPPLPSHSREPPLPSHSREPPLPSHSREPPLPSHSREPLYPPREQEQLHPGGGYTPPLQPPLRSASGAVPPQRQALPPGPQGYSSRGGPPEPGYGPRSNFTPPQPTHSPASQPTMSPQDQEKAALIMQVLSLTEEQIRMLPPEQRNSILKLKEQIARSSAAPR